jgi:hypothetical protein
MLHALLSKGYFPNELPPSFTTTNYADALVPPTGHAPPATFANAKSGKLSSFSLARGGNFRFRRRLSLVNPIHFYNLSQRIESAWGPLSAHVNQSPLSFSKTVVDPTYHRAIRPNFKSQRDLLPTKARNRAGCGAIVLADISEFYHSIYTHSIPWALHTKPVAKANIGKPPLLGDELDRLIRKAQDNQTMGIPIGPDTSLIVSEIILSACDTELIAKMTGLKGLRYFDDYEFAFSQLSEAESALATLQEVLLGYELRLNPRKTALHSPPIEFEVEWVREIRPFAFRRTVSGEAGDLIGYFDLITEHMLKSPNEHVAKYALSRLVDSNYAPFPQNVELYQSLLCQVATAEPGSIREVLQSLIFVSSQGHTLDLSLLSETLTSIIVRHAPLGHHYEVAWGVWAALNLGIILEASAVTAISNVDNSIVAILALDAAQQGVAPGLNTALWETRMSQSELYEEQWLLSYEANAQGWLPSAGGGDHVSSDGNFGFLKAAGVHFYTPTATIPAFAGAYP